LGRRTKVRGSRLTFYSKKVCRRTCACQRGPEGSSENQKRIIRRSGERSRRLLEIGIKRFAFWARRDAGT